MTKNILLTGVGGQGTILAAKMLTIGLMEEGYDVKMSEIHGMSQRGGDVTSQVRYSRERVWSPVIEKGTADIIVSFEKMEALRNLDYIRADGTVVVNSEEIPSMTVLTGEEEYAPDVIEELQKTAKKVVVIDASRKAEELGNVKAANVILLGALVQAMGLDDIDWEEIIRKTVKEKFVELNLKAFAVGKEQMK
ncbi:indolepyruvate oxidoreductase subunit beta [Hornefia butyriciproducens]|jgi:indolepyruvate ferredoxin oxidoreductase beta subunit|uniref:indolepyruvate oxidoreductase subunit beta n=1 Tax=Hornefia butyriciproducens TaxID=2652293 RepID=UPI0023F3BCA8|nr:indolepyruvate oxidoreductase subunit beta [Hornefia butyriciproducens]MCI7326740.1 indolepyruvate oxidoreductase subunit beta [Clostridiales bacterium]MCI7412171.1 indolepyruvate oxidoreductase subunit beta [Clostridiales bacterium]MDD6299699.1 indolepyruvate oxidoreductase subunit beta [Hornefia butyriciproducens]MDD7020812.1 indolepyruvate oxidoreductase subunit beta [Hornefia butyriciproducens]MDY2991710.1 indolepyruvate oxidoreductase subunit beta [Hornefia butyriciproducens]